MELNFAAAKLKVRGPVSSDRVEQIGKKHNIGVGAAEAPEVAAPLWGANRHVLLTALAGLLILAGGVTGGASAVWISPALYGMAILAGGWQVGWRGLQGLARLDFSMDALMTVAVVGAVLIGEWTEGAVVVLLFSLSEALQSFTMDRARRSLRALMQIAPRVARVCRAGSEVDLPVAEVRVGDTLLVRPGEKIAMDGTVRAGTSAVNQAAITGESLPVERGPGEPVFAGTLNGHGGLEVEVTKLVEDSTFARVVHLVEEAQAQRAPSQTFVDRFARRYTPVVIASAALIVLVPPLLLGQSWGPWIYRGLALLVVACPCALVLSTPVAIVSAISNAARQGVLIKGGAHLERAGQVRVIAFDKTGTLTRGQPEVTEVCPLLPEYDAEQLLLLAAAVESRSEHPLARAVVRRAQLESGAVQVSGFQALAGMGARAVVDGREILVGSPRLFACELGVSLEGADALVVQWQSRGRTVLLVGERSRVIGAIAVADTVRPGSRELIGRIRSAGIAHTAMLTGDNPITARAIADEVGVDEVLAELMPEEKVAAVRALERSHGPVAMVGDGVNDAPALAAATVGIAMGGAGTDVALETADIALMGDDITRLPFIVRLSRATLAVIHQNVLLAVGLKLLAILAVFPGWLTLWMAVLADTGATVLVTLNGMRLLGLRPRE